MNIESLFYSDKDNGPEKPFENDILNSLKLIGNGYIEDRINFIMYREMITEYIFLDVYARLEKPLRIRLTITPYGYSGTRETRNLSGCGWIPPYACFEHPKSKRKPT
jgi:hypothetical protein